MRLTRSQLDRKTAYKIDPLLASTVEVVDSIDLCRIDGEIDAGDFWKEKHPHLLGRRTVKAALSLVVLCGAVTLPSSALRTAEAHTEASTGTSDCPTLRIGSTGEAVSDLQATLKGHGWSIVVDGVFGPQTDKVVRTLQRMSGLEVDGIVGPITHRALGCGSTPAAPPALTGNGCDVAAQALRNAGATDWEVMFGVPIAQRESRCTLQAVNQNSRTRDDSWGPWQINYYGNLAVREQTIAPRQTNTASWEQAAANFLTLLRASGACHWQPPSYCAG